MGKTIEKILKKELKKLHSQLVQDEDKISELYDLLDETKFIAGCRNCGNENEHSQMIITERYLSCRADGPCKAVSDIAKIIMQTEQRESAIREEYGKKLFNVLRENNPVLIDLKDKAERQWDEVFGSEYSILSEDKKVSLIALIELDGGFYRLKDIGPIFE